MAEHTTYTLESDKLYNELEEKAEMKAKAKFYCVRVEKYEKILLAKLRAKKKLEHGEKVPFTQLTDEAYLDPEYAKWLDDYSKKSSNYELAKDKYNNRVAFKDMKITEESSARYLINKKNLV